MTLKTCRSLALLAVAGWVWGLPSTATGATPAMSVERFAAMKSQWRKLAEAKTTVKLEGRLQSRSKNYLQYKHLKLVFEAARGTEFRKPPNNDATIEVVGHLKQEPIRLVFVVERYRIRPTDLKRLREKRLSIDQAKPDDWYNLAKWAAGRSEFYEDKALAAAAESLYLKGLAVERRNLPKNDPTALDQLATKVAEFKLPESLRLELVHEAYQLRWNASREQKQPKLEQLAERMARELPGCLIPLEPRDPQLSKSYRADPLAVYAAAEPGDRRKLHRILYSEIVRTMILKTAAADGSNGFEVAARIDKQLPELHALAESYRDRELAFKLSRVATFSRLEAERLADQFQQRHQPQKYRETLQAWVAAKDNQLRQDGPEGLMRLAEHYQSLLADKKTAVTLLKEAYELSPKSKEIAKRLGELGYHLNEGKWLSKRELDALPGDPVQQSIRRGIVMVGMTPGQVRAAVGVPTSTARIASSRHISEVWVYGDTGLSVHFLRRSRRSGAEAKVVGISQFAGR